MSNLAKYGSFSLEQAAHEAEESERASTGADFFKVPTGECVIRILPPRIGKTSPFRVVYQHFIEVPGASSNVNFTCPRMQAKTDRVPARYCPACAKADELRERGSPTAYDLAGTFLPRRRIFANIIFRGDPERGVLIFPFGKQIHDQLLALRGNKDAGGDFCDPTENGFDIVLNRTGTGLKTEYKVFPARKLSPLAEDSETASAWLESMHDLDRYARIPTDEELRALTTQVGATTGASGQAAPTGRKKTAADSIDEP
jgi:hypothetical protein